MKVRFLQDARPNFHAGDEAEQDLGVAITMIENRRAVPADEKAQAEYKGVLRERERSAKQKERRDAEKEAERKAEAKAKRDAIEKARRESEERAKKSIQSPPRDKAMRPAEV